MEWSACCPKTSPTKSLSLPQRVGRDAVRAELERQNATATGILPGSEIRNTASNDHAVFTERIEVTEMAGKPLSLHINGVFQVDDGKIVARREYYDTGDVASQLGIDAHDIVQWMKLPTR